MAAKIQRVIDNQLLNGGQDVVAIEYNPASGAQKSLVVGPRLIPIPTSAGSAWTTSIAAATALPALGMLVAIYNNGGSAASVTVGQSAAVAALAIGSVDANGNVGVACPPGAYTLIAMGNNQWIIGTGSVICYIVEDPTRFAQQTPPLVAQNIPGYVPPINS